MKKMIIALLTLSSFSVFASDYFSCNNGALTISYTDRGGHIVTVHDAGVVDHFRKSMMLYTTYQYGEPVIEVDNTYNNVSFYYLKNNNNEYNNNMKGYKVYGSIRNGGFYFFVERHGGYTSGVKEAADWFFESCSYI